MSSFHGPERPFFLWQRKLAAMSQVQHQLHSFNPFMGLDARQNVYPFVAFRSPALYVPPLALRSNVLGAVPLQPPMVPAAPRVLVGVENQGPKKNHFVDIAPRGGVAEAPRQQEMSREERRRLLWRTRYHGTGVLAKMRKRRFLAQKRAQKKAQTKAQKKQSLLKDLEADTIIRQPVICLKEVPEGKGWICVMCTYRNEDGKTTCEICQDHAGTIRRDALVRAKVKIAAQSAFESTSQFFEDIVEFRRPSDWSDDDDEDDDAHNEKDERRILYRSRCLKKKGKRKSQQAITKELNLEYWNSERLHDEPPQTVEEALTWALIIFSPMELSTSAGTYKRDFLLSDRKSRKRFVSNVVEVERGAAQVYAQRRLDIGMHGATGPKGRRGLRREFGTFKTFSNQKNYLFDGAEPYNPVVLNGGPGVVDVKNTLLRLVRKNLIEILEKAEEDEERHLFALNTGLTGTQAQQWWDFNGVRVPGTMAKMSTLSDGLLQGIGIAGITITDSIRCHGGVSEADGPAPFLPENQFRRPMIDLFAERLKLTGEEFADWASKLRLEGIALILGNGTLIHFDSLNDYRIGHDWVVVGSILVDVFAAGWSKHQCDCLLKKGLNPRCLAVMVIGYTRWIVGCKATQLQFGYDKSNPCFLELMKDLADPGFDEMDLLRKDVGGFCWNAYSQRKSEAESPVGPTAIFCQLEGISKVMYYSSYVDGIFRLVFYLKRRYGAPLLVASVRQLVAFVVRECNGQCLFEMLVNSVIEDTFGGAPGLFATVFKKEQNLFILLSMEGVRLCNQKDGKPVWPGSKLNRHSPSSAFLWQKPGDEGDVAGYLCWFDGIVDEIRSSKDSYKEVAIQVYKRVVSPNTKSWGVGHLSCLHLFHMCALTSLVKADFFAFARVTENRKFGPGKFFDTWGGAVTEDNSEKVSIASQFDELTKCVVKAGKYSLFPSKIENYCCLKGRGIYRRYDVLMFREEEKMQCIFDVTLRSAKNIYTVEVLCDGTFRRFSDLVQPLHTLDGASTFGTAWTKGMVTPDWVAGKPTHAWPCGYTCKVGT